jgi:calmodulin
MSEFVGESETVSVDKSQFSEEQIAKFREVFSAVDTDNSGSVSNSELQNLFSQLGYDVTPEIIAELISKVDVDGSQNLSFDEFVTLLVLVIEASSAQEGNEVYVADISQFSSEELAAFREVFDFADTDKSGTISYSELQQMFAKLGYDVSPELVVELVRQVDVDGSQALNFDEFVTLVVLVKQATSGKDEAENTVVLSEEATQSARALFDTVDADRSGTVSTGELGELLRQLGYNPSEEQLTQLVAAVDDDNSGNLNFDEFVQLIVLFLQSS